MFYGVSFSFRKKRFFLLPLLLAVTAFSMSCNKESQFVGTVALRANNLGNSLNMAPLFLNGFYESCATKTSGAMFSIPVAGYSQPMDYSAVTVVRNDTNCLLHVTQFVVNNTDPASSGRITLSSGVGSTGIILGSLFNAPPMLFQDGGGVKFYAVARMSPSDFSAPFMVDLVYADEPVVLSTIQVTGSYPMVAMNQVQPYPVSAPDYGTNAADPARSTLTFFLTASDTIISIGGDVYLPFVSVSGQSYVVARRIVGGGNKENPVDLEQTFNDPSAVVGGGPVTIASASDPIQLYPADLQIFDGMPIGTGIYRYVIIRNVDSIHPEQKSYEVAEIKLVPPV